MEANRGKRTITELRVLSEQGLIDEELVRRAWEDEKRLSACWCGYDMVEHWSTREACGCDWIGFCHCPPDCDCPDDDALVADHFFDGCGSWSVAWLVDLAETKDGPTERPLFDPDHGVCSGERADYCLYCRLLAKRPGGVAEQ